MKLRNSSCTLGIIPKAASLSSSSWLLISHVKEFCYLTVLICFGLISQRHMWSRQNVSRRTLSSFRLVNKNLPLCLRTTQWRW